MLILEQFQLLKYNWFAENSLTMTQYTSYFYHFLIIILVLERALILKLRWGGGGILFYRRENFSSMGQCFLYFVLGDAVSISLEVGQNNVHYVR